MEREKSNLGEGKKLNARSIQPHFSVKDDHKKKITKSPKNVEYRTEDLRTKCDVSA